MGRGNAFIKQKKVFLYLRPNHSQRGQILSIGSATPTKGQDGRVLSCLPLQPHWKNPRERDGDQLPGWRESQFFDACQSGKL